VLRLLQEENSIAILTLPGHATDTFNYLRNRIFFMDKVTLVNASDDYVQLDLLGPQASDLIRQLGADALLEQDHVFDGEIAGESVRVIGAGSPDCLGYRLLVPSNARPAVEATLAELGAARLTADTYQMLRVERGLPAAGFELVDEYTPLEAGLGSAVSGSKGCYTGQEIIARQVTYDKVTQSLVGLQLESPAQPGERIWADGKPIGKITSCVVSPRFGQIALAIVKRPHDQPGSPVLPGADSETASGNRPAVVHSLPFS
jgi:folate-binding protein YgfZ